MNAISNLSTEWSIQQPQVVAPVAAPAAATQEVSSPSATQDTVSVEQTPAVEKATKADEPASRPTPQELIRSTLDAALARDAQLQAELRASEQRMREQLALITSDLNRLRQDPRFVRPINSVNLLDTPRPASSVGSSFGIPNLAA